MITFQCACGKRLKTKDELAGKRVKCPACGNPVRVPRAEPPPSASPDELRLSEEPAPSEQSPPADDLGLAEPPREETAQEAPQGRMCPKCHVRLAEGAVICTMCGFDLRTGKLYEPPKTLMQKIPWRRVGKMAFNLAALAIVIAVGWWAYNHILHKQQAAPADAEGKPGGSKTARAPGPPPARRREPWVRVTSLSSYEFLREGGAPALAEGFTFVNRGRRYAPRQACRLVLHRIYVEARDRLVTARFRVLKSPEEQPPGGSDELWLRLVVRFGIAYERVGGKVRPKEPYVASCEALLVPKGSTVVLWEGKHRYAAAPPGVKVDTPEDAQQAAQVTSVDIEGDFAAQAQRRAAAIVRAILEGLPNPGSVGGLLNRHRQAKKRAERVVAKARKDPSDPEVAQWVARGDQYVIDALDARLRQGNLREPDLLKTIAEKAKNPEVKGRASRALLSLTGKGSTGSQGGTTPNASPQPAVTIPHPEKALLGDAAKFLEGSATFAQAVPLIRAAASQWPHVALTFARTVEHLDTTPAVQAACRTLCSELEARRPALGKEEAAALLKLAKDSLAKYLGRAALWTLLAARHEPARELAEGYLSQVAAARVPDAAKPGPDGHLRLDTPQLAIARALARHWPTRGTEVAIALLLRLTVAQREAVEKLVQLPPQTPAHKELAAVVLSGEPKEVRNLLLKEARKGQALRPLLGVLAQAAFQREDGETRAAILYTMWKAARLKAPYTWSLANLLQSKDLHGRREAALRLQKLGRGAALVVSDLEAACQKEPDRTVRAYLLAAVRSAKGMAETDEPEARPPQGRQPPPRGPAQPPRPHRPRVRTHRYQQPGR